MLVEPMLRSTPAWESDALMESLQKLMAEVTTQDPIAALGDTRTMRVLAEELAQALAFLEDQLRHTDTVSECIRWSTGQHTRDLLSFPERVSSIGLPSPR
jgi:hypothetical protein